MILAALFVLGHTFTYLFMALSPRVDAQLRHMLSGEIMAVSMNNFIVVIILSAILFTIGIKFRAVIYSMSLDEENFRINFPRHRLALLLYRLCASVILTLGIMFVGPLLCTALLVFPPLLGEKAGRGVDSFMIISIIIGIVGTLLGFMLAILVDLPPAYVATAVIFITGLVVALVGNKI